MRYLLVFLLGCADVAEPFELDHPRVMAVRLTPPGLASGETARIDVLVTDDEAGPRVAAPDDVEVTTVFGVPIARDDEGWLVTADDREGIVSLDIRARVGGEDLHAQKTVALGAHADNPAAPAIVGALTELAPDRDVVLAPELIDPMLSYRWFSSIGDLSGYTRPEVTLEPIAGARGTIGLVVRDQAGGTAWVLAPAEVLP
jgi:hypothetical protein